jgi:hypothetical protein
MKKVISLIAISALVSVMPATAAFAQPNPAVVINGEGCNGFVPTADGDFGPGLFTPDGLHAVLTPSGNQKLTCQFDIPEGAEPARATRASGFLCGTNFGFTSDTRMVATPGGQATLTCHVNPGS